MSNLHLCVGFYPDGSFKINTVADENLQQNIEYNSIFRPGRYYFVDGKYVCGGICEEERKLLFIEECKEKIKDLDLKPASAESATFI